MAKKRTASKIKTSKNSPAKKRKSAGVSYATEHDFIIIAGGGLVVLMLMLFFFFV